MLFAQLTDYENNKQPSIDGGDPRSGELEFEAFYRWYSTLDHGWAGPVLTEQGM